MELPIEYSVDDTWYRDAILTSDGLVSPDGHILSDTQVSIRYPHDIPPYPPSKEENQCNGLTSGGNACTLGYNWGRDSPTNNIGRCKYHKTQAVPSTESEQQPYPETTPELPTRIEAEEYDTGGQGIAFNEITEQQYLLNFRSNPVDIRGDDTKVLGHFLEGEWVEYTVKTTPGNYLLRFNGSAIESEKEIGIYVNGSELITFEPPVTGDWYTFETKDVAKVSIESEGTSTIRVESLTGGVDVNWLEFVEISSDGSGYGSGGYGEGGYGN